MIQGTEIKVAFVSTNSITQGEQVNILWKYLIEFLNVKIFFAHSTFQWNNDAKGKANVYCVIIGFSTLEVKNKTLFTYDHIKSLPQARKVKRINPYLVEGIDVYISNRTTPICPCPKFGIGNKPIDGGNYLFNESEYQEFIELEPLAKDLLHPWMGATEFLYGKKRWVLLLMNVKPSLIRTLPKVMERIEAVKNFRLSSKSKSTQKLAQTPTRFHVENFPQSEYLVIPEVSSFRRKYIPIGFNQPSIIASNLVKISGEASLYHFGVITSLMHMTWTNYTCGRMKGDIRYSSGVVYNNYPWPRNPSKAEKKTIESKAQGILDARNKYSDSSLADIYDPLTMPADLLKAHDSLDRAVDRCYRPQPFPNESSRIEFLFQLYKDYTSPLIDKKK